jgi:hypothetical protein
MSCKQPLSTFLAILTLSVTIQAKPRSYFAAIEKQFPAKTLIAAFRAKLSSAANFAESKKDKSDLEFIKSANEAELKDLEILENKKLTQITLWSLNEDIKFLDEYSSSGDSDYLKASVNDVKSTIRANQLSGSREKEVSVTARTVPNDGYQVCYSPSDWDDLDDPPTLCFDDPSTSTEIMPKDKSFTIWSRDYNDASKVGAPSPLITDASKRISIGSPPP